MTKVATVLNPASITMYQVLRSHSTGEIKLKDAAELRAYQTVVSARIAWLEHHLRTHNLFNDRVSEINADLRWYTTINNDITTLLTAEYHGK